MASTEVAEKNKDKKEGGLFTSGPPGARPLDEHAPGGLGPHDVSLLGGLAEALWQREGLERRRRRGLGDDGRRSGRSPAALLLPRRDGGVGHAPVRGGGSRGGGGSGGPGRLSGRGDFRKRRSCEREKEIEVSLYREAVTEAAAGGEGVDSGGHFLIHDTLEVEFSQGIKGRRFKLRVHMRPNKQQTKCTDVFCPMVGADITAYLKPLAPARWAGLGGLVG